MKLKTLINEINFASQAAFDAYKDKHKMRDTTKVKVAGKETTAGAASKKSAAAKEEPKKKAETPKKDPVTSVASRAQMVPKKIASWADKNRVDLSKISDDLLSNKLDVFDFQTAINGQPGNKYAKDIIAKYPQSSDSKGVKYSQSVKQDTSVDGQSDEELYDALSDMGYKFGKFGSKNFDEESFADAATSLGYRYDAKNKVWNHRDETDDDSEKTSKKEEPKSEPAKKRPGNPQVNKKAKSGAEKAGITPEKLGKEEYIKTMYKAAVEALTDSNFHDEARELVASIEGKPEWAKKPNYPSPSDKDFEKKMKAIKSGVDSSEYWDYDDNTRDYAVSVSQESGWDGVEAADGIAYTLRMNGFHKQADKIQSIFDNKGYMKKESISLKKLLKK